MKKYKVKYIVEAEAKNNTSAKNHELAHIQKNYAYRGIGTSHGKEWRGIYNILIGREGLVCEYARGYHLKSIKEK